jgi:autotransporter-associated beta strand protein
VSNVTKTFRFIGGGGIGGSGSFRKQGSGKLILANGNNSFTGGVLIEDGSVEVGEAGALGTIGTGNITNNGFLAFNRTGTLTLATSISGSGSLHLIGEGTVVLSGSNSYTGVTYVDTGTLVLNGLNAGGGVITNLAGTTLTGSGTNVGPVDVQGILSPGEGIGTFTVGGLLLTAQTTNIFELGTVNTAGGGVNDLLQVNGNLTLQGTLVARLSDLPQTGTPYRLINYTGSRVGSFANVIVEGVNRYTATVSYDDVAKTVNLTFAAPANPPVVIYRETFGIAPGATVDQFATVFDWQRFDNFGQPITTTGSSSGVNYTVNGRPVDVANVNAGPNNDGTFGAYTNGILYLGATPSPSLALTTEFAVNPTNYVPGSIVFSWYEGNNTAAHTFRLLVRVGGVWYASTETFVTPAVSLANFGTQAQLKTITYNPAATNWAQVNFDGDFVLGETPGSGESTPSNLGEVVLGSEPAADLTGTITGFGVYGDNGGSATGNRRIDSFTIEAAPVSTTAKPKIASISLSNGNAILNATDGPANLSVRVLASPDITRPRSQWSGVKTGVFDSNGSATFTFPLDPNASQQFYLLQSP